MMGDEHFNQTFLEGLIEVFIILRDATTTIPR